MVAANSVGSTNLSGQAGRSRTTLRRVGAVFAGLVTIVVLSVATDAVMHATGVFPPYGQPMADSLFVLATAYRIVYGIAGSYITARLAPDRAMQHALALALIGVVISTAGAVATWGRGPEFGPAWYALAIIAISPPCAWVGARLYTRSVDARARS